MADDPFWSNLFKRKDSDEMALFEILSEIPIFQDFNTREFRKIEGILHRRSWGVGEAIVQEGNPGVGMYIIVSGDVKIEQTSDEGTTQTLAELGRGDFFGEQALLDESPRTASVIALNPCKAIGFFRPDLLELIESNPRLGLKIVMRLSQMISVRLRHTNRLLKEARQAKAEQAQGALQPDVSAPSGEVSR